MNAQKLAATLAVFAVAVHVVWSLIVILGWGQTLLNFIAMIHFIANPLTVMPFDFGTLVIELVVVALVAYVAGYVFATIWNKVHAR